MTQANLPQEIYRRPLTNIFYTADGKEFSPPRNAYRYSASTYDDYGEVQIFKLNYQTRDDARLTNHTPESALTWLTNLCKALDQRGVDYRYITFTDVAVAVEQRERRRKRKE